MRTVAGLSFVAPLVLPLTLAAQRVQGTVTAEGTLQPTGAIITLMNEDNRPVARTLAAANGAFLVVAPAPGHYRIRALRLGFRPSPWQDIEVTDADVGGVHLEMTAVPMQLERVEVSADRRCTTRPESASVAFDAWEAAKLALLSSSIARQDGRLALEIMTYERVTGYPARNLLRLRQTARAGNAARPFAATLTASELADRGYVDTDQDGATTYRAPDADVLLSLVFLDSHCLRITSDSAHLGETGISFEPSRSRRAVSDIRGTLWLESKSFFLKRLEWSYTNIETAASSAGAGGRLSFAQLPSGVWVVADWALDMPVIREKQTAIASSGATLNSLRVRQQGERFVTMIDEVGGVVVSVRDAGQEVWSSKREHPMLRLVDAETREALVGAQFEVLGTTQRSVSDSAGYVQLTYLLTGRYTVSVVRSSLATSGVGYESDLIVDRQRVQPAELLVPSRDSILQLACADQYSGPERAVVNGSFTANDGTVPSHPIRVRGTFRGGPQGVGSRAGATTLREVWTQTDASGRFHLCGLPWDEEVIVQAPEERGRPGERVTLRRDSPIRLDMVLNP